MASALRPGQGGRAWYPNFLISLLIVSSFLFSPAPNAFQLFPPPSAPLSQSLSFLVLVVLPCHVAAQAGLNYAPLSTSYFSPMASPTLFPIIPSRPPSFLVHKYKLKSESGEGNFRRRRRMLSRGMAFSLLPVRSSVRPSIHDPSKDHRHSMRSSSSSVLTSHPPSLRSGAY